MKPSAVLLIDLENFYCSREDYCRNAQSPGYDKVRFAYDLDKLLGFVRSMAENLPFTVKRAYADFNASRYLSVGPPQHYLRQLPDELLSQGVEPVQVFRLSRGGGGRGSKNAADMRMAMDATALLVSAGHVEHFVLVTGDADFIPVILELKRNGHTVSVIGVTNATSTKIQRFVDNFELFEDLLAAEEVESRSGELAEAGEGIGRIGVAVRRLLGRTRPLRFAAVKPLLTKELGYPFDPGAFGCDTTGEFLRNHQTELGVVIRQGQHDYELDLPGAVPAAVNGTNGSRSTPRPPARQPEKPVEKVAERPAAKSPVPVPVAAPAAMEPHSPAHYRHLLAGRGLPAGAAGTVKVPAVPWPVLVWGCEAIVATLTPPDGGPAQSIELLPKLIRAADGAAIPELVKHLRLVYPILRAGLPVQGPDGAYSLPPSTPAGEVRRGVMRYIAYVLSSRLSDSGVEGLIRPEALAAVFEPGSALAEAITDVTAALAALAEVPAAVPEPAPPPPPKPASVEEWHTASGYVKLLKNGGAKGSDTESFKVLPVPWTSIERVCADVFPVLTPAAGGSPLPREELTARLVEAGKELFIERYDQHVRRVLGILRVAGDLIDDAGVIALNPEIISAQDLRNRTLAFLLQLLQLRLEEREVYDPIRPTAFVTAIEAGPLTDHLLEEVAPAIEWLYRPANSEPQAVEATAEPVLEVVEASSDLAGMPPGPDSGVVALDLDMEPTDSGVPLDDPSNPVPLAPLSSQAMANSDPGWDSYAFDGSLPGSPPSVNPVPVAAWNDTAKSAHSDAEPAFAMPVATESPSGVFGVVDVAVITSEAVAAATDVPAASEPPATSEFSPEPEPFAFASSVTESPPTADEEILTAVPVADWLPDGDPLFSPPPVPQNGSARPTPPPLPAAASAAVARITPPPLPAAVQPPPYPPLPPESA